MIKSGEKSVDQEMKKVEDKKEKAGEKNEMEKLMGGECWDERQYSEL